MLFRSENEHGEDAEMPSKPRGRHVVSSMDVDEAYVRSFFRSLSQGPMLMWIRRCSRSRSSSLRLEERRRRRRRWRTTRSCEVDFRVGDNKPWLDHARPLLTLYLCVSARGEEVRAPKGEGEGRLAAAFPLDLFCQSAARGWRKFLTPVRGIWGYKSTGKNDNISTRE